MNYSQHSSHVRVDFFKESGKWYCTEEVTWNPNRYDDCLLLDAFDDILAHHLHGRLKGMWAVCLDPYHKYPHPIMIKVK